MAFDSVKRNVMIKDVLMIGVIEKLIRLIRMRVAVKVGTSKELTINKGIRPGYLLLCLISQYTHAILKEL